MPIRARPGISANSAGTHTCTIFLTTPTFLRYCLKQCEEKDFGSLRFC